MASSPPDTPSANDAGPALPYFLSCTELAQMLRVSERTLENWRLKGWGPPYIRMGTGGKAKVLYSASAVLAWLKTQEHNT